MRKRERTIDALIVMLGPLAGACVALALGQNDSWDLRNYHWYNAYALLQGRIGFDVAVAHHATYYNPLLDMPVWWLGNALPGWLASLTLGLLHGTNASLVYLIARDSLAPDLPRRRAIAAALALVGSCGAYAITLTGSTHHDNAVSIAVLFAVWLLVRGIPRLDGARWRDAWPIAACAGVLIGASIGMKLPTAPFGLGLLAALAAVPSTNARRLQLVFAGGFAALIGLLITGGWWYWRLWQDTGNPFFPFFNDVIGSPLLLDASYRDARFLPNSVAQAVAYPFRAALDWRVSSDWPVTDWRIAFAYAAVIFGAAVMVTDNASRTPLVPRHIARVLFAFAGITYLSWLAVFAIYRYIVPLEMLAPLLIVAGIGLLPWPARLRFGIVAIALIACVLLTRITLAPRVAFSARMVEVTVPAISRPQQTMALMTGIEPMAFVIPSFPANIPFLRIDGWLVSPKPSTPYFERMATRIAAHRAAGGDLFVLFTPWEGERTDAVLADIALRRTDDCQPVRVNMGPQLQWCRVESR
jgi:hypothetical protein